jgi:hypothetical protein
MKFADLRIEKVLSDQRKGEMKANKKKFMALILIASLIFLSSSVSAKGKRGAVLIIQKKDGLKIKGELILVKLNSLLLIDSETSVDISVALDDIKIIKIAKKSKLFKRGVLGALAGAGTGALITSTNGSQGDLKALNAAVFFGCIGLLCGGLWDAGKATDEIVYIYGMLPYDDIDYALKKLRPLARLSD